MSPILVRPVREQLEHDRVIRLLLVKLKRKNEVIANIGEDQSTSIKIGLLQIYPDLVLTTADRARKLLGTVEVETSESVNHLEARSQWAHLGRARAPFHLYVPLGSVEIARRLSAENQVNVTELWSFHTIGDQTHFRLVQRTPEDTRRSSEPRGVVVFARPEPPKPVVPPPPPALPRPVVNSAPPPPAKKPAASERAATPVAKPAATKPAAAKPAAAKSVPAKSAAARSVPAKSVPAKSAATKPVATKPAGVAKSSPARPSSAARPVVKKRVAPPARKGATSSGSGSRTSASRKPAPARAQKRK